MVTIFEQGDIAYVDFDPQADQKDRRLALVVSNNIFNLVNSLTIVCPISPSERKCPYHVHLDQRTKAQGAVLCDQARMLDLSARRAEFVEKAPAEVVAQAVEVITGFFA